MSGEIQLTMSATETVGTPSEGTFYVDGSRIASVDDDAHTYSATLDTVELDDGPHTLTVSAKNSDSKNSPVSAGVPIFVANKATASTAMGDFNGDGKADLAVLYKSGQDSDGVNHTALWTFTSTGSGFNNPVRNWESVDAGTGSWNWDRSKLTSGDFNGDGKADVAVLYNNGAKDDGYFHTALWTFTSNGTGFANPVRNWENIAAGSGSWNWDRSDLG